MLSLPGLQASSLLGFLAALGVCRLSGRRLAWRKDGPVWLAVLETGQTVDDLAEALFEACKSNPLAGLEKSLKLTPNEWLGLEPEWSAAVGCEDGDGFRVAPIIAARGGSHQ